MSEAKFTPGPWSIGPAFSQDHGQRSIFAADSNEVANVTAWVGDHQVEALANAHLIAAAPDLYNATKDAVEAFESVLGRAQQDNWEYRLGGHAQDFAASVTALRQLKATLLKASPPAPGNGGET